MYAYKTPGQPAKEATYTLVMTETDVLALQAALADVDNALPEELPPEVQDLMARLENLTKPVVPPPVPGPHGTQSFTGSTGPQGPKTMPIPNEV